MFYQTTIKTEREGFYELTEKVNDFVQKSGITEGICVIYTPHTTAAVTINKNADATVQADLLLGLREAFPFWQDFRHSEGKAPAHLKVSAIGSSVTVIIHEGYLLLGTWQGIYLCEFDGPRERQCYVKIIAG